MEPRYPTTEESVGLFIWPLSSDGALCYVFRRPGGDDGRSVDEIPMPELVALARELLSAGLTGEDAISTMARAAGLKKLREASRERLQTALSALMAAAPE
jgi:hypothetical protein